MNFSPVLKWSRGCAGISLAVLMVAGLGCVEAQDGGNVDEYYGGPGTTSEVSDPIEFTDRPYDFVGEMPIGDLVDLAPTQSEEMVWYGFSSEDPYPIDGDCNPEFTNSDTIPASMTELPTEIEGIVTVHPRYFENMTLCGSRERYYGTYVIEDASGGIQVMKNSRVADFDIGDRVRLRVRGITRHFGTVAVIAFDNEQVLTEPGEPEAVYYEDLYQELDDENINDVEAHTYRVRRMRGEVVLEATNQNFNEMHVQSEEDPDVEWVISLDRELGARGAAPKLGDNVQLTGPILNSFGLRMLITSLGQIEILEPSSQ